MSNFTQLAMQNRDAESMRKRRRKQELEEALLSGGSSGGSGSSSSSGEFSNSSESGIVDYSNLSQDSQISQSLNAGNLLAQAASDVAGELIQDKVMNKAAGMVDDLWKNGGKTMAKEGLEEAGEFLAGKAGRKIAGEAMEFVGGKLVGKALGFMANPYVAAAITAYEVADLVSQVTTGKSLGDHAKDTLSGKEYEPEEWEEEHNTKGNTVSIRDAKKNAEEEKKKQEIQEAEKARKAAEEKLKNENNTASQQEEEEEEEEGDEEEDDDIDDSSSNSSAMKRGLKSGLMHTLGTAGGTMAVSLSMIGIYKVHYTGEFEYKGISAEYQSSNYTFQNFVDYDDNGDVVLKGLTKENKLVKTFYTKYSDKSYYAIVEDSKKYGSNMDEAYLKKNLLTPDELREQYPTITDVNNREAMFQLNPDVLYVLDKYIHKDEVMYPQQFVKPLYYEENQKDFGLKDLLSDDGKILAKSQVFNNDGSPAKNSNGSFKTTPGIWDYGFASILRYKEYEVPRRKITVPLKRVVKEVSKDVVDSEGDVLLENLVSGGIPGSSSVTVNMSNRPDPAYIIDTAVTPGGTITNEIEKSWQRNSDPAVPSTKTFRYSIRTGEKEICSASNPNDSGATPPQSDSNTSDIPGSKPEDYYSPFSTRETTVENGETCTVVPTYTVYEVTDHYESYVEEELPQYVGEPSSEGINGSEYFRDYMSAYSNYYPEGLPNSLDFRVLENEEIQSLIYDDDPNAFVIGGVGSQVSTGKTVVVDAGHGGADPGASGNNIKEKDVVLAVAKEVQKELESSGYRVIMTRSTDTRPLSSNHPDIEASKSTLYYRSELANTSNADAFVSIHANSPVKGPSDTAMNGIMTLWKNNKQLAELVQKEMITQTGAKATPESDDGTGLQYRTDLHLLNQVTAPSILIETGYVTNKEEANKLKNATYQKKLAKGIANGVKSYLSTVSTPSSASIVSRTSTEYANYSRVQARNPASSGPIDLATFFQIGSSKDSEVVTNAMQHQALFTKYGNMYGVDPYLLMAMAAQEKRGIHDPNSSPAVGIMQIEEPGSTIKSLTAYNFEKGAEETMIINGRADVANIADNIRAGAMQLASRLKTYEYNPVVSLQSYNLGPSGLKYTLSYYLGGGTKAGADSVYGNNTQIMDYVRQNDLSWITTEFPGDLDVEKNSSWGKDPNNGTHEARTWYKQTGHTKFPKAGGGDPAYLEHVLRYYAGPDKPWVKKPDGSVITIDGSATTATGGSTGGTPSTFFNSYLNSNWAAITEKWDLLFPGQKELDDKLDLVKKGDYTKLAANYQAKARDGARSSAVTIPRNNVASTSTLNKIDKELALNMMFALNQGNYLFKYDNMTEAEWKAMYTQLLSSPTGQTWDDKWIGFTVEDIFGVKTIDDLGTLFPTDIGVTPSISVAYGMNKNNVSGDENKLSHYNVMNFGIDIIVPPDTDVLTVADGTVVSISDKNDINSRYGNYVKIQHAKGTTTITANLKTVKVKVGDTVKLGDVIGTSGGDCKSYKDNAVYYQITNNGNLINPTWVITREMTGFEDPIAGNNGVICGSNGGGNVAASPIVSKAIEVAKQNIGKPYVWGATGPSSFDCSGFMYYIMKEAGVEGGRDTALGYHGKSVEVPRDQAQPGDFIFWHDLTGGKHSSVYHIGLYMGNDEVIDCSTDHNGVGTRKLSDLKDSSSRKFTVGRYSKFTGGTTSSVGATSGCQTGASTANNGYLWPVPDSSRISAPFGEWRDNNTRQHKGIDIAGKYGGGDSRDYNLSIVATVGGTVEAVSTSCPTDGSYGSTCGSGWGNYVKVKDEQGNYWIYAHMTQGTVTVGVGDTVSQGQELGKMGNSGSSKGVHLHYEVRVGGDTSSHAVDPLKFVKPPS